MAKFGIGQSARRVEDPRLLTGGGRYTDDTKLAEVAVRAYVLRSPHAHADIKSIDTSAARKAPGVHPPLPPKGLAPAPAPTHDRQTQQRQHPDGEVAATASATGLA